MKVTNTLSQADIIKYKIPTICPYCGEPLVLRDNNTKLYCENEECVTHLSARLSKWINILDVKGFGDALQKFMVEECRMTSICDLYKPEFKNLVCSTYGSINAEKAFNDLYSKRNIDLATLIAGFNIEGIGLKMSKTLVENGYDSLESLHNVKVEDLERLPNWSSTRANIFLSGIKKNEKDMKELAKILKIQESVKSESSSISGMHICITGKLEKLSRKDVEKLIKSKGANFDTSVTSNTDILVTNDTTSGSSKLNNARKYETKIISEEEFYELLNS